MSQAHAPPPLHPWDQQWSQREGNIWKAGGLGPSSSWRAGVRGVGRSKGAWGLEGGAPWMHSCITAGGGPGRPKPGTEARLGEGRLGEGRLGEGRLGWAG